MIEFKTEPYTHQLTAYNAMEGKKNYALFCEMGTGKSKMLIDDAARLFLQDRIDLMFILCPNGLQQNWILREIPTHLSLDNYKIAYSRSGMGKKETISWERIVKNKDNGMFKVLAVNIDQLVQLKNFEYYKQLLQNHKTLLVVDESQRIKNPSPLIKRSHRTVLLGQKAIARRIASGTPMPNGPLDLFNQYKFLNLGILGYRKYAAFKSDHAIIVNINFDKKRPGLLVPKVTGYKNIQALKRKMKPVTYAVKLRDCVDMPSLIFEDHYVDLTSQQERMYKELQKEAIAAIDNPPKNMTEAELICWVFENPTVVSKNALSKSLRLVQVLGGYVPDSNGKIHELDNKKMKIMLDLLEDEPNKKFIIWAQYRAELVAIEIAIKKKFGLNSCVSYHGSVSNKLRIEAVDRIQQDPVTKYFIGQYQSAGVGLTLTAASRAITYSLPYHNWEHFIQSIYRIFRIGQHKKVVVTHLISEHKADVKILKNILEKGHAEANLIWDEDVQVNMFIENQGVITDPSELLFGDWQNE